MRALSTAFNWAYSAWAAALLDNLKSHFDTVVCITGVIQANTSLVT